MTSRIHPNFLFASILLLVGLFTASQNAVSKTFTPNGGASSVNQGALGYTLPIQLPPLPGRLELSLAVGYSDRAGAGLFGSKADLQGLPRIQRCAASQVFGDAESRPVTMTDSDRLCLNGNPLRNTSGGYWQSGAEYRTGLATYSRITKQSNGFRIEYKNGNVAYLTHQIMLSNDSATYGWAVESIEDRYGNTVEIDYKTSATYRGSAIELSEALPDEIRYGDTVVDFFYKDGRDLETFAGLTGGKIRKTKLIDKIEISLQNQAVQNYAFSYSLPSVPSNNLESVEECGKEIVGSAQWQCANAATFEWVPFSDEFDSQVKKSASNGSFSGPTSWPTNVLTGDWNGDGVSDLIKVSAANEIVAYEGGPNASESLERRLLRSAQTQNSTGDTRDIRTAFAVGDVNDDGRDDVVFAEGTFNTANLVGVHEWKVLLSQPDGSSRERRLSEIPSLSSQLETQRVNERAFFLAFYFNTHGIRPIIADVTGSKRNEIIVPVHTGGDTYGWKVFSVDPTTSTTNISLTEMGVVPDVDASQHAAATSVRVRDDGASQILFVDSEAENDAWKLYSNELGLLPTYQLDSPLQADCTPYFLDVHSDGLSDILFECGSSAQLFVSNGVEWTAVDTNISGLGSLLTSGLSGVQVGDVEGGGDSELLLPPENTGSNWRSVRITREGGYVTSDTGVPYTLTSTIVNAPENPFSGVIDVVTDVVDFRNQVVQVGDFSGDGIPDLIQANGESDRWELYTSTRKAQYGIQSITDNKENKTTVFRTTPADQDVYTSVTPDSEGFREVAANLGIVDRVESSDGRGGVRTFSFSYHGSNYHKNDLGFTGFNRIDRSDSATGLSTRAYYEQGYSDYRWRLNGRENRTETRSFADAQQGPVNVHAKTWSLQSTSFVSEFPYVENEITADLDGNHSVASVTEVDYQIDPLSGVKSEVTTKIGGGALVDGKPTLSQVDHQKVVRRTNIDSDTTNWLLGFVGNIAETSVAYNADGSDIKVTETAFTRWPGTLDVGTRTHFPGDNKLSYKETFNYDASGNITSRLVSGNSNIESREWTYSGFQNIQYPSIETAPLDFGATAISYDYRYGTKTAETGPNGLQSEKEYDGFGRLVETVSGSGTVTEYSYEICNGDCNLPGQNAHVPWHKTTKTVSHPDSTKQGEPKVTEFYDQRGRKIGMETIGFNGEPIYKVWKYDAAGRKIYESRPFKGSAPDAYTEYSDFDYAERPLKVATYTSSGREIKTEEHTYTYANPGMVREAVVNSLTEGDSMESLSSVVRTTYDSRGNKSEVEEGVGTMEYVSTAFEHDAHDNLSLAEVNADPATTVERLYDAAGNLISEDDPDKGLTTFEHDALGNLIEHEDANGNSAAKDYDLQNRLVVRTDYKNGEEVDRSEWFYDRSSVCDSAGRFVGKLCLKRQDSGFEESYQYNASGHLEITSTDLPGLSSTDSLSFLSVPDAFGREVARSYPNDFTAYISYNQFGYVESFTDDDGQILKSVTSRDAEGEKLQYTLGNGLQVSQTFSNAVGNLSSVSVPDIFDESYTWFGNGSLFSKADSNVEVTYSYDPLRRLSAASTYDLVSGETELAEYGYDLLGNLESKPGVINGYYDDPNQPNKLTRAELGQRPEPVETTVYEQGSLCSEGGTYKPGGYMDPERCEFEVGEVPAPDHSVVTVERCSTIQVKIDGNCYEKVSWECSKYGRVYLGMYKGTACGKTWKMTYNYPELYTTGSIPSSCPSDIPLSRTTHGYMPMSTTKTCYDTSDRHVVCPAGSVQIEGEPKGNCRSVLPVEEVTRTEECLLEGEEPSTYSWGFKSTVPSGGSCWHVAEDPVPQCRDGFQASEGIDLATEWEDPQACSKVDLVTPDPGDQQDNAIVEYSYDNRGNVTQRGLYDIAYTTFNKPSSIEGELGRTSFHYGPDRSRYRQDSNDGTTFYVGGDYEEVHSSGSVVSKAFVGDFLQVTKYNSTEQREYLHRDHLGSIRAITDSNANRVTAFEYEPFGSKSGSGSVSNRGFTDHEHLEESGLIHMNGRVYDPLIGRFLSTDPIVQAPYSSQNYNRYSYLMNNPLSFIDPTGYFCVGITSGGFCNGLDFTAASTRDAVEYWRNLANETGNPAFMLMAGAANAVTPEGAWGSINLALNGLQMGAAKAITPVHPTLGYSLFVDASSSWMGNVDAMSAQIYGFDASPDVMNDWVGDGFRSAGDFYLGSETAGEYARLGLQLGAGFKAALTPVSQSRNADYISMWYDGRKTGSALLYLKTVPAYQTWGITELFLNGLSSGAPVWDKVSD